jgi:hypothetical protein
MAAGDPVIASMVEILGLDESMGIVPVPIMPENPGYLFIAHQVEFRSGVQGNRLPGRLCTCRQEQQQDHYIADQDFHGTNSTSNLMPGFEY